MRNILSVCIALFIFLSHGAAQEIPVKFGKVTAADFEINSLLIDSNTNAVIIADQGVTTFTGNKKGWFSYLFKRKTRIKILNKNAYDLATVEIPLYNSGDNAEKVTDLIAATYNLENGKVKETRLDKKDILEDRQDRNHTSQKFALPAVTEGSIIEYSYTVRSDYEFNLPAWKFQHIYHPTLWSEYSVTIPMLLSYMVQQQGTDKFLLNERGEGRESYSISRLNKVGFYNINSEEKLTVAVNTVKNRWVMKDIKAFRPESNLTTPENYIDKINFQLFEVSDGETTKQVSNTWTKVAEELLARDDFGKAIEEPENWMKEAVATIIHSNDTKLQQAKKILAYIRDNFTQSGSSVFIKSSLRDVFRKKNGSLGEINLLLTALLRADYISSSPVLLSTRGFGRNRESYPMLEKLNYIVCKATIDDTDYFLDATERFLGFGKLPLYVYNGHARLITKEAPAVYFLPEHIKESSIVKVNITTDEAGTISGNYLKNPGYYQSENIRKQISSGTMDAYKKKLSDGYENITVTHVLIDSLQALESPVLIRHALRMDQFKDNDIVYFNPLFGDRQQKNPFTAENRLYPVEMPYLIDETYELNMQVPKGYKIDELPKPVRVILDRKGGLYEYQLIHTNGNIQLRRTLKLTKTDFDPSEYDMLREFFINVIKKDSEQIVFKKAG